MATGSVSHSLGDTPVATASSTASRPNPPAG